MCSREAKGGLRQRLEPRQVKNGGYEPFDGVSLWSGLPEPDAGKPWSLPLPLTEMPACLARSLHGPDEELRPLANLQYACVPTAPEASGSQLEAGSISSLQRELTRLVWETSG